MKFAYIDESIHEAYGFIIAAAVVSDQALDEFVYAALKGNGYVPQIDEFKSSTPMVANPRAGSLRAAIQHIIFENCKIAIAICSTSERKELGTVVCDMLEMIVQTTSPLTAYFDQGIVVPASTRAASMQIIQGCDSRIVAGIQLADYAANVVSLLLKEAL